MNQPCSPRTDVGCSEGVRDMICCDRQQLAEKVEVQRTWWGGWDRAVPRQGDEKIMQMQH